MATERDYPAGAGPFVGAAALLVIAVSAIFVFPMMHDFVGLIGSWLIATLATATTLASWIAFAVFPQADGKRMRVAGVLIGAAAAVVGFAVLVPLFG